MTQTNQYTRKQVDWLRSSLGSSECTTQTNNSQHEIIPKAPPSFPRTTPMRIKASLTSFWTLRAVPSHSLQTWVVTLNIRKEGARLDKNLVMHIRVKQSFTRRVEIIIIHQPLFIGNIIKDLPQPNNHFQMDSFRQKLESHWFLSIKTSQNENGTSSTF